MIGTTIKDFKITRCLGEGGMGEVWAAEQQIVHTRVAIKLLRAEVSQDRQLVDRFFNEAVAVGRIKHAGIVKIFDVGYHAGRAYLIMEHLEGEPLASRIARSGGRLPVGATTEIARQIASILEATHVEGIVHRDLKPDNIFLVPDRELPSAERAKILDFGIAKLGMNITQADALMGTPPFMAPEQWERAASVDGRADVYSLGCIVFQMCCGRLPFEAEGMAQWYAKHRDEIPPRARSLAPELPAELDDLIARMLAKAPADRPTARALVAVLGRLAANAPMSTLSLAAGQTRAPTPPHPDRRPKGPLIAAGGAAVAAAAVAVILAGRCGGPHVPADAPAPRADEPPAPGSGSSAPAAGSSAPAAGAASPVANRWVKLEPPATSYLLGVSDWAPKEQPGFRASRRVRTPGQAYELQEHEVTWSELDPWLAAKDLSIDRPPQAAAALPATNVTWSIARAYCQALGGELPTEEQWEYAARGPERRPNPWGEGPLDRQMTRAYAGPNAAPSPVMSSAQDRTPGPAPIWDLAGNVQEWTLGLWREDLPDQDERDVQRGETSSRTIRGLPLAEPAPQQIHPEAAAFRKRLCATGLCVEKTRAILAGVGFRCARAPGR